MARVGGHHYPRLPHGRKVPHVDLFPPPKVDFTDNGGSRVQPSSVFAASFTAATARRCAGAVGPFCPRYSEVERRRHGTHPLQHSAPRGLLGGGAAKRAHKVPGPSRESLKETTTSALLAPATAVERAMVVVGVRAGIGHGEIVKRQPLGGTFVHAIAFGHPRPLEVGCVRLFGGGGVEATAVAFVQHQEAVQAQRADGCS
mmetsp:Transcript_88578/g.177095  ORF Transcript_88578/g.177095 Transcript_88578/m.177095 type:complete len:201 (-) Transcript_88578:232-834(-)